MNYLQLSVLCQLRSKFFNTNSLKFFTPSLSYIFLYETFHKKKHVAQTIQFYIQRVCVKLFRAVFISSLVASMSDNQ